MIIPKHVDDFVKEMRRLKFAETTIVTYESNVRLFLSDYAQKQHPLHVNKKDIVNYLCTFSEPNTQRSHHAAIKKYYSIVWGQDNKCARVAYARKNKKLPIVLSQDEIQQMINVCNNKKHRVILILLYATGIRRSELLNLKWAHIDRSRMIINVIQGKGKKDRQVPLPAVIIPELEKYFYEYRPTIYVLNGQNHSTQYSAESINQVIKQLAQKAGIKKRVHAHLIRHCYATHFVEAGSDINLLQKILGHSSVKTTNIYLHTSDSFLSKINSPINNIRLNAQLNTGQVIVGN